ncbi:hypothetical protein Tco_0853362 [Tanacetum coccineum]
MSSPKFAEMHNVVAFLEKPIESDGFAEIIDFLKASSVHYALTVNPIIYTSCIEQFWATAKVQTVNGVRQLQALVDKKRVIITESSIRRDLHLDDAEGTDCLPTATIFEELERMGYEKPSQKHTFYKAFFSPQWKYFIHTITQCLIFINQQLGDMSTHKKIFVYPFHTKKVFANMKSARKDFSGRITPLFDTIMVQASEEVGEDSDHPIDQPSTSSKPKKKQTSKKTRSKEAERFLKMRQSMRKVYPYLPMIHNLVDAQAKEIATLKKRIQMLERNKKSKPTGLKRLKKVDVDQDDDVTLVVETQERQDDELMFDTRVLDADEMHVEAKIDEKDEQSTKLDDSTAGEAVTTASVEGNAAPITIEEITLAQTLIQIKAAVGN